MKYVYFYNAEVLGYENTTIKRLAGIYTSKYKLDCSAYLHFLIGDIVEEFQLSSGKVIITSLSFLHEVQD